MASRREQREVDVRPMGQLELQGRRELEFRLRTWSWLEAVVGMRWSNRRIARKERSREAVVCDSDSRSVLEGFCSFFLGHRSFGGCTSTRFVSCCRARRSVAGEAGCGR
jgi:hypothetical protein